MDAERKAKRKALKEIKTFAEYEEYIGSVKLTDEQRTIADMMFLRGWDHGLIGDTLGYEKNTISKKAKKILDMLKDPPT